MPKPERQRGLIIIDIDRCKGCEMCTVACPVGIISMDTGVINVKGYQPATVRDMRKCIGCGSCALVCPDVAITVQRLDKPLPKNVERGKRVRLKGKTSRQLPGAV